MNNKETIEEAGSRIFREFVLIENGIVPNFMHGFKLGAKHQAKIMYSDEIINILNNILYWDTCPDDYKVIISNFLNKHNNEQ
jgi:hypothetical protein